MPILSNRLKAIFNLVPENAAIADIGTDHAYLPAALVRAGRVSSAIACDIREKPLKNAAATIDAAGVSDKVSLRLSDGLDSVSSNEVDTVIVAGMGGDVISGIISRAQWLRNDKLLILQPMTSAETLRRFLCNNGYNIESETAIEDSGRYYTIMLVRGGKSSIPKQEPYYVSGKLDPKNPCAAAYLSKQLSRFKNCAADLSAAGIVSDEYNTALSICRHLEQLLEES